MNLLKYAENGRKRDYFNKYWTTTTEQFFKRPQLLRSSWSKLCKLGEWHQIFILHDWWFFPKISFVSTILYLLTTHGKWHFYWFSALRGCVIYTTWLLLRDFITQPFTRLSQWKLFLCATWTGWINKVCHDLQLLKLTTDSGKQKMIATRWNETIQKNTVASKEK